MDDDVNNSAPEEPRFFGEAQIMTPGWDPETDPRLAELYEIAQGPKAEAFSWKTKTLPLGAVLASMCVHKEGPKDGPGFVGGEVIGERRKAQAMKRQTFAGLDIDTGMSPEAIDAALIKLDCMAARYTTHSNMKTVSEFLKSRVVKFAQANNFDPEDFSVELLAAFMAQQEKFESYIIDSIDEVEEDQTERGFIIRVTHCPIPKNRIVFPLAEPFVMAKEAAAQKDAIDKWKKVPAALAELLGVPIDFTGVDPSRLFYYPRHKRGAPHECRLFGGKLFDWRSLELENPFAAAGEDMVKGGGGRSKGKSVTDEGRALGKWAVARAQGFQIVDVLREHCEDRIRAEVSAGVEIECPFDEDHTNAGDTDDRACLAVNAGEGTSEIYTISCRHESCQDKTALDMLGKMIKDGWFPAAVIDDEEYNALAPEEAAKEDAASEAVAALNKSSDTEKLRAAFELISQTDDLKSTVLMKKAGKLTGLSFTLIQRQVAKLLRAKAPPQVNFELKRDKQGRYVFSYYAVFDAPDMAASIQKALADFNAAKPGRPAWPRYTMRMGKMNLLRGTPERPVFELATVSTFRTETQAHFLVKRRTDKGDGALEVVDRDSAEHAFNESRKYLPDTPTIRRYPHISAVGDVIDQDGWNEAAGVYLAMGDLQIGELTGTAESASAAVAYLREEVLGEFPFDDGSEGDSASVRGPGEAAALALMLQPLLTDYIAAPCPMALISKPTRGTGGTMLAQIPFTVFDGREVAVTVTSRTTDDEEIQKLIVSGLRQAERLGFVFDNIIELSSVVLCQTLTGENIGGRILQHNLNFEVPNRYLWIATGNNPRVSDEMERRLFRIYLDAKTSDPQNREFKRDNFTVWLRENRGVIITHLLNMILYWQEMGSPEWTKKPKNSFERWSKIIGGVLETCHVEGFGVKSERALIDLDAANDGDFLQAWLNQIRGSEEPLALKGIVDLAITGDFVTGVLDEQRRKSAQAMLSRLAGTTQVIGTATYSIKQVTPKDAPATYHLVAAPKPPSGSAEAAGE